MSLFLIGAPYWKNDTVNSHYRRCTLVLFHVDHLVSDFTNIKKEITNCSQELTIMSRSDCWHVAPALKHPSHRSV